MLSMECEEGGQPYPADTQRTCVVVPAERLEVLMYLEFRITRNNALWPFYMWGEANGEQFGGHCWRRIQGLQDENLTQIQARKETSVVMIWMDQEESCLDTSTLNLLSLSLRG